MIIKWIKVRRRIKYTRKKEEECPKIKRKYKMARKSIKHY